MITKETLEKEKLSLHLKYISGISFACICLVIILHCCQNTMFQNCISVSSTVTSIILSVVAIILSVTGERTTNEIRNKVADSVEQLEDCTEKSSLLTEELIKAVQQMNELYTNVNDNVSNIPQIKTALDNLLLQNRYDKEDIKNPVDVLEHIVRFLNDLDKCDKGIKSYVKDAYTLLVNEKNRNSIPVDEIAKYLVSKGANKTTATVTVGIIMGNLSTGMVGKRMNELIQKL